MSSGVTPIRWFLEPAEAPSAVTRPLSAVSDAVGSTNPAPPDLAGSSLVAPTALAGCEILEELGRGGMGVVYKARQVKLNRLVALKMVLAARPDANDRARFWVEAEAVARVPHPNIVQIYEVGEDAGRPYCLLEFVDGPDLARVLDDGPLPVRDAAELVHALADAVQHAHDAGIVHRDLKPANVLLASGGREPPVSAASTGGSRPPLAGFGPKITDFGLAKRLTEASAHLTQSGQVLGTPSYMAPEQAQGDRTRIGPAVDVYALGAILYECLTGRPPFKGDTPWDTLVRVVHLDATPPRRWRPEVPAALETVCLKALAKDPERRYATAGAMAADLQRFLGGAAVRARRDGWLRRQARAARRQPLAVAAVFLGLVLAAALGSFAWLEERRLTNEAAAALRDGEASLQRGGYGEAARSLDRGLQLARQARDTELTAALDDRLALARRGLAANELHVLAERIRFLFDPDGMPAPQRAALESSCRKVWEARNRILAGPALDADTEQGFRTDLLDLGLFWADLRITLATAAEADEAHRQALALLAEVETRFGPSVALARQRQAHCTALGREEEADAAGHQAERLPPRTAWEHYALGRALLRAGQLDAAAEALKRAAAAHPDGFWLQFYRGVCAYRRGRHDEAVSALSECLGKVRHAASYHNRALALTALGRNDEALEDYDQALRLDPTLAAAALNRGLLHAQRGAHPEAVADLLRARELGADGAMVCYNLAVVHESAGDRGRARACLREALRHNPEHMDGLALLRRLEGRP